MRGATRLCISRNASQIFQSTLPMRGATYCAGIASTVTLISIHTPHAGSDARICGWSRRPPNFNPHSPCGERRQRSWMQLLYNLHFNPHSPCGERLTTSLGDRNCVLISIHTPHAGSDPHFGLMSMPLQKFQSTLPMRGATPRLMGYAVPPTDFNPHSPCGERRQADSMLLSSNGISIHTPHAGSDSKYS